MTFTFNSRVIPGMQKEVAAKVERAKIGPPKAAGKATAGEPVEIGRLEQARSKLSV